MRPDLTALRARFHGTVRTPSDVDYEAARVLFNTRIRTRPAALCRAADTDDVVAAVRFARDAGLPLAVRGGGHHARGFCLAEGGVVVDVRDLKGRALDLSGITVTAGAGCTWREIDQVTYLDVTVEGEGGLPHGYAPPGGECPTVGNAGYSLGGGYGLLGRRYGLACDHIVAATMVDARGEVLRVTEEEHPDLLWALRGAGGAGFGVVTDLTYRLDPVPKTVLGGVIAWPLAQARDVLAAYRDLYTGGADDRLGLFMAFTTEPYPDGEPVLLLYGMFAGPPAEAWAAMAPLRALGTPLFDGFAEMSYVDLQDALGAEIVYGLQSHWRGGWFRDGGFDEAAFDLMVEAVRTMPSGYSMIRFDLLGGGAIGRVAPEATAFVHRSPLFYASVIAQWAPDEATAENVAWADELVAALGPYLTGEVYQNYADADLADWPAAYYGANYPRLQQVKARYDPHDVFRHPQSIRLP